MCLLGTLVGCLPRALLHISPSGGPALRRPLDPRNGSSSDQMERYCVLLTTGLQRTMRPLIDADCPLQQNRSQRHTRVHELLSAEYSE